MMDREIKVIGKIKYKAYDSAPMWSQSEKNDIFVSGKLVPPDGFPETLRKPSLKGYLRAELPFNPEDIEFLPEKKKPISLEELEFWVKVNLEAGAPNIEVAKECALRDIQKRNITRQEAEEMLQEKIKEFEKKILKPFLEKTAEVTIVPPSGGPYKPYTVYIKKGDIEKIPEKYIINEGSE